MKRLFITLSLALAMAAGASAQSTISVEEFNRAVMQTYEDMLRENYKDYEVLFRRANAYFTLGDYLKALDDLDSAVKYAPESDTDTRFAIYALRTECYAALKRYAQAIPEADEALKIEPADMAMLNLRGRLLFDLGRYEEAKADYSKMLRIQPRSEDAFFGLALVAVKEHNLGVANEYMDKAVSNSSDKAAAFVRRAQVKEQMADYNGAVDDLLLAIATDSNNHDALPALVKLADSNYSAVVAGLSNAIRKAPRQALFYFLRGSIAESHFHYGAAIEDYKYIIDNNLYEYSGLYCSLAECYYALGQYQTALDNVDSALGSFKEDDDVCHYYIVRSRILRALGQADKALTAANRALDFRGEDVEATVQKALVLTDLKKAQDASALLGEVIMADPYEPMHYMQRAWILNDFLNQQKAAKGLYGRVIDLELDHSERLASLLGFAELFNGQTAKGIAWIDAILAEPDYDGSKHYYGACFYAWAGKTDKALKCVEAALKAGYANYHDWTANKDSRINVEPLRSNAKFKALLEQYKSIFAI